MKIKEYLGLGKKTSRHDKVIMAQHRLRPAMWVTIGGRIGILKSINFENPVNILGVVMLTDKVFGLSVEEITAPLSSLKQATYDELPKERHVDFSKEKAAQMGYY